MINEEQLQQQQQHRRKKKPADEVTQKMPSGEKEPMDPYKLEALKKAQIERNNEWIEKMSPIVKYKEYIRKQRAKKMQRRKFSLACGLNHRNGNGEPSSSVSLRRRPKKKPSMKEHSSSAPVLSRNLSQPGESVSESRKEASAVSNRRKSAPIQHMDMRDLDDLE
ncbi:Vitellogenin Regulating Protein [Caenorhabditis elegans]|uniref:Vitellogenin Regulating Protein n=1 Tax=Caenorhabditis elegans TaxID=6239 RepID=H2L0R3_CAEEL|nr:Vitellogenin Regulating Protein [Caenorhabditis elegans]CCD83540.1 Vitellogenin Regulating Protein [Caenorhabditis elegans]|eukprot:NP_001122816.1 Vitellogenin Regulating Protein [Caenorhabditis elegans]